MTSVFNLLFDLFESVIGFMKEIPLTQNVSLFDFSIAILIMSIIVVAFVPIVQVGSTNYVNETLKAERVQHEKEVRQADNENRVYENRRYQLMTKKQKQEFLDNYKK